MQPASRTRERAERCDANFFAFMMSSKVKVRMGPPVHLEWLPAWHERHFGVSHHGKVKRFFYRGAVRQA
jgi:hypothetical protein